jgi:hypothetical protein
MKKLIFTLCILSAGWVQVNAQACGTNGPSVCTPTGGPANGGFEAPNSTPCVTQSAAYTHAIQFTMFNAFDFQGHQTVDSIEFVSIDNLPCGLCWAVDQVDKRYAANEDGCLNISGTTTDAAGQYKLALSLKAWINGQLSGLTIPASLVDQTGIRLYLRVKTNGGQCANVDTSANAANLNATIGNCLNSVNELERQISALELIPNPMNSNGILSFIAEKTGVYSLRITDITGKQVNGFQFDAHAGQNQVAIEKNNLPAGVYFLSITDGKNALTKRFSVTE